MKKNLFLVPLTFLILAITGKVDWAFLAALLSAPYCIFGFTPWNPSGWQLELKPETLILKELAASALEVNHKN